MRLVLFALIVALLAPAAAMAAGAHEGLSCVGCHGIHTAKDKIIFAVEANKASVNPANNQPYSGITALCLGCHEDVGGMGIMPIKGKMSHPYDVKPNPKVATVPAKVMRDGKLACVGCHDPHPSNPNYKYLRVNTDGGASMEPFCNMCHASKSGNAISDDKIFDSMDEKNFSAK